jgi:hypothetical protein
MTLRIVPLAVALLVALPAPAAHAHADDILEFAAFAVRNGETVYVDPGALQALPEPSAAGLRGRIEREGGSIYLVVVPRFALVEGVSVDHLLAELLAESDREGVYGMVVGDSFDGAASGDELVDADAVARDAAAAGRGDIARTLAAYVDGVARAREDASGSGAITVALLIPAALAVLALAGLLALRRRTANRAG